MKIVVDTFLGDKNKNEFMHCLDVFSNSKQLAEYNKLEIYVEGVDFDNLVKNIKESFEKCNMNVVFISIRSIDGKLCNKYNPYIMPGVNAISSGKKFGIFQDMLETIGYKVSTNQMKQVENANLIIY